MTANNELRKKLLTTFKEELDDLSAVILQQIQIGKNSEDTELPAIQRRIIQVSRNIKVAAQSADISGIPQLAEGLENLFNKDLQIIKSSWELAESVALGMQHGMSVLQEEGEWPSSLTHLEHELQNIVHGRGPLPKSGSALALSEAEIPDHNEIKNNVLAQILETFSLELEENNRILTTSLLELENKTFHEEELQLKLQSMFRAAHNIKGAARGVGADEIAGFAHQLEHNFQELQLKKLSPTPDWVNKNLQLLDAMMQVQVGAYAEKLPPSVSFSTEETLHSKALPQAYQKDSYSSTKEYDSVRISLSKLELISADLEQLQSVKISLHNHQEQLQYIEYQYNNLMRVLRKNAYVWEKKISHPDFNEFSKALFALNKEVHTTQQALAIDFNELSLLTTHLQEEIGMARLLPVQTQLAYFPRMVRDLAQALQKPVVFDMKHNDVKIDKLILDGLKDPLLHLLRNALDHGLEAPEQRLRLGKSEQGHISLEILQEDQQVIFKISDDGAGIDAQKNIQIALQRNLLTRTEIEGLTAKSALELIFLPGFSSREVASEISGRGVGLDVVRSNLVQLKGTIAVESTQGKGTVFHLRVPITLATEHGVIVRAAHQLFVISTEAVERILLINDHNRVQVEGKDALLVEGHPLLLCSLAQLLGISDSVNPIEQFTMAVVIQNKRHRIALVVDDVLGERELLLKPLAEPLTTLPGVDGATILGDEQISFILNAHELIRRAQTPLTHNYFRE
ncbi:MAG: chemotaxis protein CheW [Legionella sp.]|nr:chemotaxis protein CheW [Legionella sp.]